VAEVIGRNYRSCLMASCNKRKHEQTPMTYIYLFRVPSYRLIKSTMGTVQATCVFSCI
jgi:hypothetical protein